MSSSKKGGSGPLGNSPIVPCGRLVHSLDPTGHFSSLKSYKMAARQWKVESYMSNSFGQSSVALDIRRESVWAKNGGRALISLDL